MSKFTHECKLDSPHDAYGVAIDVVLEDKDSGLWAGNGEYYSQVNYCPVCGYKAKKQVGADLKVTATGKVGIYTTALEGDK